MRSGGSAIVPEFEELWERTPARYDFILETSRNLFGPGQETVGEHSDVSDDQNLPLLLLVGKQQRSKPGKDR
jgi:hypothetical protein